jgi:hypothetical protein
MGEKNNITLKKLNVSVVFFAHTYKFSEKNLEKF